MLQRAKRKLFKPKPQDYPKIQLDKNTYQNINDNDRIALNIIMRALDDYCVHVLEDTRSRQKVTVFLEHATSDRERYHKLLASIQKLEQKIDQSLLNDPEYTSSAKGGTVVLIDYIKEELQNLTETP